MYFVKTPWLLKKWYSGLVWDLPITTQKTLYLSFDDGPHPIITNFVLDELKKYNAKATFFCIGKNVVEHIEVYNRIKSEGHSIGNHTQNHLNGFKTSDDEYIENVKEGSKFIQSSLFRPPYGRVTKFQAKLIQQLGFKIIMWDVLSGDFDMDLSKENCTENVLLNAVDGSIIVFHDSEKAYERLQYALPKTLEHFNKLGYEFQAIH